MLILNNNFPIPEHLLLIAVFFVICAGCALLERRRSRGGACIGLGVLALGANVVLLALANRVGYGQFDIVALLTLQNATVESTLIVIGYCLLIRGLTQSLRARLQPRPYRGLV